MDSFIGKRIDGRYLISELIGIGGMANVYKATDITDNKVVAVKILREEYYGNEEFMRRFKNESKAIAMLSHPNIIKVYDVCFSTKFQSIVMEYVDGVTLKEYLEQQSPLSWKETLHFVIQILKALDHAHERGIVHRDIKPQNVMMLSDGSIKITDFGIARFARSETRTLTDRAIGSVHYMSPEQARGEHTDQRADIYSVGAMMYEMLTGKLPFDAENPVSVALKQIQLEAPSPRSINPDIPEALEEITMHAMQKDPDDRFQSAGEMLEAINSFKRDPSVHFEYRYLTDSDTEQRHYAKAVNSARTNGGRDVKHTERQQRARRTSRPTRPEESRKRRPRGEHTADEERSSSPILAAMFGVTVAFVVITIAFIGGMLFFNNPLEKVPDVIVPDLKSMRYEEVSGLAQYSDFVLEIEETRYDDMARGQIISQKPKAGTKAKKGSTIKVVVSNGQKAVTMPYLLGYEETSAYAELVAIDLGYERVDVYSTQQVGTVVETVPAYGEEVSAGTVVEVRVSVGPEIKVIAAPDLTGMTYAQAYEYLNSAGLEVGEITARRGEREGGIILEQDPAPGEEMRTGESIDLTVSSQGAGERSDVTLSVALPAGVTDFVELKAVHSGTVITSAEVRPSDLVYWRPSFSGTGEVTIFILYNDFLYQTYEIDFSTGTYKMTEDNSSQHY